MAAKGGIDMLRRVFFSNPQNGCAEWSRSWADI